MHNDDTPYINPVHALFPFADLLRPEVSLSRFFDLLDAIDPIDRNELIGLTASALGVEVDESDDEEAEQADRYRKFKKACDRINAMDHVILRGVVQDIMNVHHRWATPAAADHSIDLLRGFVEFSKSRGASDEELARWQIMAAEKQVGKKSDLQVALRRYDLFCYSVVQPLIGLVQ